MRVMCGNINEYLNKEITIFGWVKNVRKMGSINFILVSDITGTIQVVTNKNINLSREFVVKISGIVIKRKNPNPNIFNGDLELKLKEIEILSESEIPPLIIEEKTDALEEVRFQNRFLDLRRPNIQKIFIFKSNLYKFIHDYFNKNNFIYIDTPILGKPTPEGARDFLVPSRIKNGSFYALPQSPQIYKQLFMLSGFEKYYQIVKCFRDEDLRSDRQPEFTQLDIETSFLEEEQIYDLIENFISELMWEFKKIKIPTPFQKMDYSYSILHYGNDKPDTRFENLILDSTKIIKESNSEFISNMLSKKYVCRSLVFENNDLFTNKTIKFLEEELKKNNLNSLFWIKKENDELKGSLKNKIEPEIILKILEQHKMKNGIVFLDFNVEENASYKLGIIRTQLGKEFDLINKNQFNFLWVINWPLFEFNEEEQKFSAAHHPFTQPQKQYATNFYKNKKEALARSYDIVLNGVEIGGGSVRITSPKMQKEMFEAIGLSENEYKNKFSILLNAFKYGVPPHAGIALGLDRLIQLLLNLDSIKECIAFPKNNNGIDPMMNAPSEVNVNELNELGITIKDVNK